MDISSCGIDDIGFCVSQVFSAVPRGIDGENKDQSLGVREPSVGLDIVPSGFAPVKGLERIKRLLRGGPFSHGVAIDMEYAYMENPDCPSIAPRDGKALLVVRPDHSDAPGEVRECSAKQDLLASAEHESKVCCLVQGVTKIASSKLHRRRAKGPTAGVMRATTERIERAWSIDLSIHPRAGAQGDK